MKTVITLFVLASCAAVSSAADRVLTLTGAPHPKALVQSVDAAAGVVVFAFADADGHAVDSGNSIARFMPEIATPAEGETPAVYAEPSDATLAAAIVAPEPPPPVPAWVTRRQLKQWLIEHGHIAAVETALAGIEDATARAVALNWWTESLEFRRDHPLVAQLTAALGMSGEQVDAAFREAAAL